MEDKLLLLENMLRERQKRLNLISNSTVENIRDRHINDSLQILKFLPADATIIDLGSGGGFPALTSGIGRYSVFAVESDHAKCDWLNDAAAALELENFHVICDRAEKINFPKITGKNKWIWTARAFAPLSRIFDWTAKWNMPYVLLKGERVMDEIKTAQKRYKFDYELYPSATGPGFIVIIKNVFYR
jgi:16S rRNA (guanine527-N7)-methyltransferase